MDATDVKDGCEGSFGWGGCSSLFIISVPEILSYILTLEIEVSQDPLKCDLTRILGI